MGRSLFLIGSGFLAVFLLVPMALVFSAIRWDGSASFLSPLLNNLGQALLSATLSLILAVPLSILLRFRTPFSRGLRALTLVPLVLPQPVVVLSLVFLFGSRGFFSLPFPLFGLGGIVLAHALYNFPLAARILSSGWPAVQSSVSVARSLGARRFRAYSRIGFPLLAPSLVSAFTVAFAFSFTSFSIPLIFGGTSYPTLEVLMFRALSRDFDVGRAAFLALLQVAVFLPFVALRPTFSWLTPPAANSTGSRLIKLMAGGYVLVLSVVLFGPLLRFSPAPISLAPVFNSVRLALVAALISLGLWLTVGKPLSRYSFLLFGISPMVLAVGYFGFPHSFWLLAIGHALLAFPLVGSVLDSVRPSLDRLREVALGLGASSFQGWHRVLLPAYAPTFATAFLFAFGFSLGESALVMSLGDGFSTVSSVVVSAFGSYRFSAGYFYVLVLALFAIAASLGVDRFDVSRRAS